MPVEQIAVENMSMKIVMPKTGLTNTENMLDTWSVSEGDAVKKGQVLAEIESEKTTMPFESPADGIIHLIAKNGDTVAVAGVIAYLADNKAEYDAMCEKKDITATDDSPASADVQTKLDATEVVMPKTGLTNTENALDAWSVSEGDTVTKGQVLAEIESEKTTMPFESPSDGIIHLVAKEGDTVPVGNVIAYLAADKAGYEAVCKICNTESESESDAAPESTTAATSVISSIRHAKAVTKSGRVIASPLARKRAAEKGVDLSLLTGSGPGGRIVAKDVEAYQTPVSGIIQTTESREPEHIPLTPIRKAIARNMFNSLHSMAQTSDSVELDVTKLMDLRKKLVEKQDILGTKITINDLLSYAAVKMIKTHPLANASYTDTEIISYPFVNLSMAVATDYGLTSPVVRDADKMSLVDLSKALHEITAKARNKKLTADDQRDGTFTLTNMGIFPVDDFNPILPAPQSCIIGFGRCMEKPAVYQGEICIRTMMVLSVTYDHRVFDGGEVGSIMKTMKEYLENPELFLVQ
ncbi:MAG: 2-oxo acid dehydrogenase subunit E2 [Eubacteriales bacterium]|nr:2-oxo acid dehydrogenase subunit E2 [Eubacteriales bacterium]